MKFQDADYLVLAAMEARVVHPHVAADPLAILLGTEEGQDLRAGDDAEALS